MRSKLRVFKSEKKTALKIDKILSGLNSDPVNPVSMDTPESGVLIKNFLLFYNTQNIKK